MYLNDFNCNLVKYINKIMIVKKERDVGGFFVCVSMAYINKSSNFAGEVVGCVCVSVCL